MAHLYPSVMSGRRSGLVGLACKRCGGEEHTRNGFMRGKQRYRCRACGLNFTDTPPRGMPLQVQGFVLHCSPEASPNARRG